MSSLEADAFLAAEADAESAALFFPTEDFILEDFFAARREKVVTLFLGQMSDPGDLIGLPHLDEATGRTEFMLPYWFPVDGKPVVLFLDELNRARPEVLQTVMDLTLNRKLAGKSLPEGVFSP